MDQVKMGLKWMDNSDLFYSVGVFYKTSSYKKPDSGVHYTELFYYCRKTGDETRWW